MCTLIFRAINLNSTDWSTLNLNNLYGRQTWFTMLHLWIGTWGIIVDSHKKNNNIIICTPHILHCSYKFWTKFNTYFRVLFYPNSTYKLTITYTITIIVVRDAQPNLILKIIVYVHWSSPLDSLSWSCGSIQTDISNGASDHLLTGWGIPLASKMKLLHFRTGNWCPLVGQVIIIPQSASHLAQ